MSKSTKPSTSKQSKPRGRNGGKPPLPPSEKKEQTNLYLASGLHQAFKELIPLSSERQKLMTDWVRAYVIFGGESDRLLAQSPLSAELAAYLAATDAPQELQDKLESLMVQREWEELKIGEGVISVGDSYIA